MNNKILINNKNIETKKYNGEIILTAYDIAELHERDVKRINENFRHNIDKFVEKEDYYIINKNSINDRKIFGQRFIPNNMKQLLIFNKSGYLLLSKTFQDDFSWKIEKELLKKYFNQDVITDIRESTEEIKFIETTVYEKNDNPTELQKYNFKRAELLIKAAEMLPESKMKTNIIAEASYILTDGKIMFINNEDF
jgi:hypothetical protein